MRDKQKIDGNRQKRKQLIVNRLRQTALHLRKAIKKPKTYEDYKRELRENRDEIELLDQTKPIGVTWSNFSDKKKQISEERKR